ncbi:MAG: DNA mismatch repair endonuclease MutL [Elusimicrobia bacterium]|nr:DNA mismatch repair endonuclease MutL [Elusimicrobiota bacterium]
MKIRLLSQEVSEKIAAGEVIERPSSIVKELLENSLDAGAKKIDILFEEGGSRIIEVSDDGSGMTKDELPLAVRRHATSKISSFEDLDRIMSMGFRGEALPSIAAVSRMKIISRATGAEEAYELKMEGPGEAEIYPAARASGTLVRVEDLFFNLPARRKFLKTPNTERKHIMDFVKEIAIIRPDIYLKVMSSGRVLADHSPSSTKERFIAAEGKKLYDKLLEIDFENPYIRLEGYISHPEISFANRNKMHIYVNSRPVSSSLAQHAIATAYREFIPPGRFPAILLNIIIKPSLIDINIHPSKREVKFIDQQGVYQIIRKYLTQVLEGSSMVFNLPFKESTESKDSLASSHKGSGSAIGYSRSPIEVDSSAEFKELEVKKSPIPSLREESTEEVFGITLRFQWNKKYVVGEDEEGILIIDQHTAWERINYEKIKKDFESGHVPSQGSLFPEIFEPGRDRANLVLDNLPLFQRLGFEIEEFGPDIFRITAFPSSVIVGQELQATEDILDLLEEGGKSPDKTSLNEDLIKSLACRSSVMAGERLSFDEMRLMITELMNCQIPHRCPHGRPVIIRISESDMDKKFGR